MIEPATLGNDIFRDADWRYSEFVLLQDRKQFSIGELGLAWCEGTIQLMRRRHVFGSIAFLQAEAVGMVGVDSGALFGMVMHGNELILNLDRTTLFRCRRGIGGVLFVWVMQLRPAPTGAGGKGPEVEISPYDRPADAGDAPGVCRFGPGGDYLRDHPQPEEGAR